MASILLTWVSCSPTPGNQTNQEEGAQPQPKTIDLLASKSLDDWDVILDAPEVGKADVWSFNEAGHLVCKGEPLGFLSTRDEYTNFKLTVEWRWPGEPGNSGVLMRIRSDDPIPTCLEAQLKSGSAGNVMGLRGAVLGGEGLIVKEHSTIGTLHIIPKKAGEEKTPGEWNRYEITVEGDTVRVFLNGELASEGTGAEAIPGPIGFQSEGGVVEFRNMVLTVLE